MEINIKDGKYYHYLSNYNYGSTLYNQPIVINAKTNFKYINLEIGKVGFLKSDEIQPEIEQMIIEIENTRLNCENNTTFKNWGLKNDENNCYINTSIQVLYNLSFYNICKDLFMNQSDISNCLIKLFLSMRNKDNFGPLFDFIRCFQKQANESFGSNKQNDVYTFILELQKILMTSTEYPTGIKKMLYDKNFQQKSLEDRKIELQKVLKKHPYLNFFQSICEFPNKRLELMPNLDISKIKTGNSSYDIVIPAQVLVFKSNSFSQSVFVKEIFVCGKKYEINSIVSYVGDSYSGHYYTHCKVGKNWIRFGDTSVKIDNNSHYPNAYIVFYKEVK